MAHIRQSRPDSAAVFEVNVLENFRVVPSLVESRVSTHMDLLRIADGWV